MTTDHLHQTMCTMERSPSSFLTTTTTTPPLSPNGYIHLSLNRTRLLVAQVSDSLHNTRRQITLFPKPKRKGCLAPLDSDIEIFPENSPIALSHLRERLRCAGTQIQGFHEAGEKESGCEGAGHSSRREEKGGLWVTAEKRLLQILKDSQLLRVQDEEIMWV